MVRPLRVLITDDDVDSREMYAHYLTSHGIEVLQAENGAVAIQKAIQGNPDLIVMDLQMPVMGGLEAITRLRDDERTRSIPVVVLSANGIFDHAAASRAGSRACLVKPCSPEDLEGVVRAFAETRSIDEPPSRASKPGSRR